MAGLGEVVSSSGRVFLSPLPAALALLPVVVSSVLSCFALKKYSDVMGDGTVYYLKIP